MTAIDRDRLTMRLDRARSALRAAAAEMERHDIPHLREHAQEMRGAADMIDEWIDHGETEGYA